jgi:hypothetical protein
MLEKLLVWHEFNDNYSKLTEVLKQCIYVCCIVYQSVDHNSNQLADVGRRTGGDRNLANPSYALRLYFGTRTMQEPRHACRGATRLIGADRARSFILKFLHVFLDSPMQCLR